MSSGVRGLGWGEETRGQGREEIGGERKSTWVGLFWGQGNSQLDAQVRNQGIVLVSSLHPAPQSVPYHVQPVPPPAEADFPFPLTTPPRLSAGPCPLYLLVSLFHTAARMRIFTPDRVIFLMHILQGSCAGCRLEFCGQANKVLCDLSPSITHACIPPPANIMLQLLWILCIFLEHAHALHCLGL